MRDDLRRLLSMQTGHFVYESGHHGDLWLDLDRLFVSRERLAPLIEELALLLAAFRPEIVCGPQVGGAFLGQMLAAQLGVGFVYAQQFGAGGTMHYALPAGLKELV